MKVLASLKDEGLWLSPSKDPDPYTSRFFFYFFLSLRPPLRALTKIQIYSQPAMRYGGPRMIQTHLSNRGKTRTRVCCIKGVFKFGRPLAWRCDVRPLQILYDKSLRLVELLFKFHYILCCGALDILANKHGFHQKLISKK